MVGMSGGVDSSVAALLLMREGYEVVGATFKLFSDDFLPEREKSGCCSLDDVNDARFVCESLGIAHYVLNYKDLFQKKVLDYFAKAYLSGRTPNPCIACNRHIKFDAFLKKAVSMGFDYISTGHYAKITRRPESGEFELHKALHSAKDQSYVLYRQTQESLSRLLLPLGGLSKEEVRKTAEEAGLRVYKKPDSQDICFVPDGDYPGFIRRYSGLESGEGNFLDAGGKIIGRHKGYYKYTVGQRRGLGMGFGERFYVLKVLPESNAVVLGRESELYTREVYISGVNIISGRDIQEAFECGVKTRYSQTEQRATAAPAGEKRLKIVFEKSQKAAASGQSAVLYSGEIVLGGGEIE
ncbi:MAG: tRNA 2-thiouridine(34) synthase MnmA [Oscillospiraceae bacterium]|jgi:tRNA-specific 2-thiouridylase|nr:tRNA 2-thiouridine(34) synthase MnmA [Oscillospiraceae bacterium]